MFSINYAKKRQEALIELLNAKMEKLIQQTEKYESKGNDFETNLEKESNIYRYTQAIEKCIFEIKNNIR
jgi:predicted RNase H-like nuclease (RuvC/YqgF family)